MKRKFSDRVLSLFLSLVMVFSSIPINSFATTSEGDETIVLDDKPNYYLFIDQQTEFGSILDVDDTKEYIDIFEELDDEEVVESEPNVEPTEPKLLFKASEYAFESEANLKVNIEDGYQLEELIIQELVEDDDILPEDSSTELVEPKQVEYTYDEETNIVTFVIPEFDVFVSASFSEKTAEPIDLGSPADTCTGGSHNYTSTKIEPTCTTDGFTTNVCLNCGDKYVSDEIKSEGHQYDEKITKEATETEEGVKTFTCYLCGDSYEEVIPVIKKEDNLIKNPAPNVSDLIDGESTTPDVYIRELSTKLFYGTESTGDGNVWTAKDYDKGHRFSFRINYAISGVDVAPENTVRLSIPKSILNTRNDERGDYYEMSIPSLSEVEAFFNGTGESIDNDVNFAYYENGSEIIIYNFRDLPAGYNGYIELSYYTSQTTYHYVDMEAQSPFTCIMTAPMNSMEAEPIVVKINTTARITSTDKRYPTKYTTWQPAWGNEVKPENAENYHYLVWTIASNISATQPYNFTLEDTITGNFEGMEVVGYKFSGQSNFTNINTIENQTIRNTRYDYVITSIPLDVYQPQNYWEANNNIIATVDPVDQIDADTQATDSEKWSWTKPKFEGVTGHVNVYKRADGAHRTLCMNGYSVFSGAEHRASSLDFECSEYTRYDMESFNGYNGAEITNTELDGFKYASWIVGYPYPWTYDSSYNDPLNPDAYGKIPVKYELIDEGVCLTADNNNVADNSEMLTSEDFRFESLGYSFLMTDAIFDKDAQNFKEVTVTYTENDVITFYGKFGTSDEWVQFASFNLYTKEKVFDENYVKSMTNSAIVFNNNVDLIAYKLETTNAHYYTELFTVPHLTLKNSQTVMDYVSGKASIGILNHNKGNFYEYEAPITNEASEISTVDETADDPYAVMPLAFDSRLYKISKVDENGNPVIGATLQIVEIETDGGVETGNEHVQYEWVSDGNHYEVGGLEMFEEYSIYDNSYHVLREVLAPEGYELADDIVIDPDTEGTTYITMIDEKNEPIIPNKLFAELTAEDAEYARISQRYSDIEKSIVSVSNNPKKKTFTISWKVKQEETMEWGSGGDREYIPQNGGTFYDLLPEGATFDKKSVDVQVGYNKFLPSSAYTVETIDNYQGTGRIMLIIMINVTADNYVVYYDTLHPWNSIKDYGNDVYNPVAYETGNSSITNGFPDNGGKYFTDGTENPNAIKDYVIMSNLNPDFEDTTARKFIYAEKQYDIVAITAASSGLMKKVKAENDSNYSYETTTTINGNYSYQLRYMNSYTSASKNMIFYDSLENYDYDTMRNYGTLSDWRGTLQSIDTNQLESKGIAPVIYYSTISKLDIEDHHDINDTSVWDTLTDNTDLSTIKAIAIDMRKTVDGEDFVLNPGESVVVTLHMKAPSTCPEKEGDYAYTYNNIYISDTVMDAENTTGQDFLIHQDYTTVKLLVTGSFGLEKVSIESEEIKIAGIHFRLFGISYYGTEIDKIVSTDMRGQIYFKDIEMGSYILQEYKSTDDWLLDTTEYRVVIDNAGKVWINDVEYAESYITITNAPRVHGDLTFLKKELGNDDIGIVGTTFCLEGISEYGTDVLIYSTSNSGGRTTFENIELGTYTLTEVESNPNYKLNNIVYTVKVDENGLASIVSSNETDAEGNNIALIESQWFKKNDNGVNFIYNDYRFSEIELRKIDASNNTIFLEGAIFSLTGVSNYGTKVDMIASSDRNGYVLFDGIEEGFYLLKEIQAPTGLNEYGNAGGNLNYVLDETIYIVTIDSEGSVYIEGLEKEENTECFIFPNERAYDKEIVIKKIWNDGLTSEERLEQGIIPKLHLTNRDLTQDEDFRTHKWDGGEVLSTSTCSKNGETLYTCVDCGVSNVRKTPTLEHMWDEGIVTEATCYAEGYTLYTCQECGATKSITIEKLAHIWDEGKTVAEANCIATGKKVYACTTEGCDEVKEEIIEKLDHVFDSTGTCLSGPCGITNLKYTNLILTDVGKATISVSSSNYDYFSSTTLPYYSKIITFIPEESGTYMFTIDPSSPTSLRYARLYSSSMSSLSYVYASNSSSASSFTYNCTANTVYYLAVGNYNMTPTEISIPVTITKTS